MPINSVAGTPTTRSGRLARAGRMWLTPEQGGLRPEFRDSAVDRILEINAETRRITLGDAIKACEAEIVAVPDNADDELHNSTIELCVEAIRRLL